MKRLHISSCRGGEIHAWRELARVYPKATRPEVRVLMSEGSQQAFHGRVHDRFRQGVVGWFPAENPVSVQLNEKTLFLSIGFKREQSESMTLPV
jgi:hypothetical protein